MPDKVWDTKNPKPKSERKSLTPAIKKRLK